jgi:hypothetical protein
LEADERYLNNEECFRFVIGHIIETETCEFSDVNINNEECFSFRYWAYDDYQAGKNIYMTHYRASFNIY